MVIQFKQEDPGLHYQIHPAAMLFPEMEGDQWSNFVADIRDNGQREAIVVHDGKVIDGRNRLRACRWLKIDPKVRLYQGREDDILSYVLSLNLNRRHLSESQRAMVAAKIANKPAHRPSDTKSANLPTSELQVGQPEAAKLLSVSERSVRTAKQITAKGEPEIAAAVEAGTMTLNEASKVIQLRPEMQKAFANLPKEERRQTLADDSLSEMGIGAPEDGFEISRIKLARILRDFNDITGSAEQIIGQCPKFMASDINSHFRKAYMKMQALHAVYQNWEFRNVLDD